MEVLKSRSVAFADLERLVGRLNASLHEIKFNLSELFELYETEYDSNLRLQQHLNEFLIMSSSSSLKMNDSLSQINSTNHTNSNNKTHRNSIFFSCN